MIFFNLKALEKKLIDNHLSDKDAFNYFLILTIITSLSIYILNDKVGNYQLLFFDILFSISLTYLGLKKCFNVNSTGDNQDFYKRLFSLSFVIVFRLIGWTLLLLIPYILILMCLGLEIDSKDVLLLDVIDFLFDKVLQIMYYIMLYKSLYRVSRQITTHA